MKLAYLGEELFKAQGMTGRGLDGNAYRGGSRPATSGSSGSGETRPAESLGWPLRCRPLGQSGDADGPFPEPQGRVEQLLEGGTEGVLVGHAARHVVKSEDADLLVQENPEPVGVVAGPQTAALAVVEGPVLEVI